MRKTRVYADTSVFGGALDDQFAEPTKRFFQRVRDGELMLLVSRMVLREIRSAPKTIQKILTDLPPGAVEYVEVDDDVEALADAYVEARIVGPASKDDAVHVAAATVAQADLILSWNFRHIVNYSRIHKYNAVNALNDYAEIEIHSPLEIGHVDEDQNI